MILNSLRTLSNSDPLGRYYTSSWISKILIDEINLESPELVLELGVGGGALTQVAAEKWKRSRFITVDIDREFTYCSLNRQETKIDHTHYVHDALDHNLATSIGISRSLADIAVCNPPYMRLKWKPSFEQILESAGLINCLDSIYDTNAELLFLAQNLMLLKDNGKLGLILPDGLVVGEKFQKLRRLLLTEHSVEQIIQLPRRVFEKTEAQTYLVLLTKNGGPSDLVKLTSIDQDGKFSTPIFIDPVQGEERLDYRFHYYRSKEKSHKSKVAVSSICTTLERGTINSNQIKNITPSVFHLGDFPSAPNSSYKIPADFRITKGEEKKFTQSYKIASKGDILIARIGRDYEKKIVLIESGSCLISDCIFKLRVPEKYKQIVFQALAGKEGKKYLKSVRRGVGANYLCKNDILSLKVKT